VNSSAVPGNPHKEAFLNGKAGEISQNMRSLAGETDGRMELGASAEKSTGRREAESPTSVLPPIDMDFDESLYDTKGVPKLEEFIPKEYLPDVLIVHDRDNLTSYGIKDSITRRYVRRYPTHDPTTPTKEAHLYLSKSQEFGRGSHSSVFRACFLLPPPLTAPSSPNKCVTVAVKRASQTWKHVNMLLHEGKIYNQFPTHLQESWSGYNMVPNLFEPVPIGPVVPKFYGFYVPNTTEVAVEGESPTKSPLLLIEECGEAFGPWSFTLKQK
jgi:hypothetical protein